MQLLAGLCPLLQHPEQKSVYVPDPTLVVGEVNIGSTENYSIFLFIQIFVIHYETATTVSSSMLALAPALLFVLPIQ